MELNEQDIALIDRYLQNELSGNELKVFNQRMQSDPAFADAVALQQELISSIQHAGRQHLKEELSGIGQAMVARGDLKEYTPGEGGESSQGNNIWLWVKVIIILGLIGFGSWAWLSDAWMDWFDVERPEYQHYEIPPIETDSTPVETDTTAIDAVKEADIAPIDTFYESDSMDSPAASNAQGPAIFDLNEATHFESGVQ